VTGAGFRAETAKDNAGTWGAKTREEKGKGKEAEREQCHLEGGGASRGDRAPLICDLHSFLDLHKACLEKVVWRT
jgi:hypothetical protein